MLGRVRYLLSDVVYWVRTHRRLALLSVAGLLLLGAAGYAAYLGIDELAEEDPPPAPAPEVIVRTEEVPEETSDLGFPAFATRNTTRIAGIDPIASAAAAALATFPSTGVAEGPAAVTLVDDADWAGAIAAASLVAAPVSAPMLLTDEGETPDLTASALRSLAPRGSADTNDRQAFTVGAGAKPDGLRSQAIEGSNPAELAAAVARTRARLTGSDPEHIVIASSDEPAFAMPAAAWSARSGDPVLYAQRDSVPEPTLKALEEWKDVPVYVLGPEEVISEKAERQLEEAGANVARVSGDDPVTNAVEFARYVDGTFGWNINDPGHGFVIASTDRPADAGAAAPLSASGTWGPLLLTDDSAVPPPDLAGYLLDLKPGYEDDPTRAVYNHIWLIGDEATISVDFQAEVDEIAEVAPVKSGGGEDLLGPVPGTPETETEPDADTGNGAAADPPDAATPDADTGKTDGTR